MPEIIDNVFMRATEFMHQSGMRMDVDHVGQPQDLYLWCLVDGAKNWSLWGCPMRFTIGCPCAIRITETRNYLTLQIFGDHTPDCHTRPKLTGRNSAPALGGHKSYYSPGKDSENVGSGESIEFFRIDFSLSFSTPSLRLTSSSSPRRWRAGSGSEQSLECRSLYYARVSYGQPHHGRDALRQILAML